MAPVLRTVLAKGNSRLPAVRQNAALRNKLCWLNALIAALVSAKSTRTKRSSSSAILVNLWMCGNCAKEEY